MPNSPRRRWNATRRQANADAWNRPRHGDYGLRAGAERRGWRQSAWRQPDTDRVWRADDACRDASSEAAGDTLPGAERPDRAVPARCRSHRRTLLQQEYA